MGKPASGRQDLLIMALEIGSDVALAVDCQLLAHKNMVLKIVLSMLDLWLCCVGPCLLLISQHQWYKHMHGKIKS